MTTAGKPNPVVFIHGMWIHSSAWQPWLDLFASQGYSVSAPGWPGDAATVDETRDNPEAMANIGTGEIVDHYAGLIGTAETKPILVGHSFGGLVAQELLAMGIAAAAVAIDPAGVKGVKALPFAQLRSAFPVLGNPANRHRGVALTAKQFHYAFGNMLSEEESDALHAAWTIPGPGLARFQEAGANFSRHSPARVDTHLADRGPRTAPPRIWNRGSHGPPEGHTGGVRDVVCAADLVGLDHLRSPRRSGSSARTAAC